MTKKIRSYTELSRIPNFEGRLEYLKLDFQVGDATFGSDRLFNQRFYRSPEWRRVRSEVIRRDQGLDLGVGDELTLGNVVIHHMNPLQPEDLIKLDPDLTLNPEYLVATSVLTHSRIHYRNVSTIGRKAVVRTPGDTAMWKPLKKG